MYGASAWSTEWKRKIKQLEKVERKFTKTCSGLEHFSYIKRLYELKAVPLEQER